MGRLGKYVKEDDLKNYQIPIIAGVLKILYGIISPNDRILTAGKCDDCIHAVICRKHFGEGQLYRDYWWLRDLPEGLADSCTLYEKGGGPT